MGLSKTGRYAGGIWSMNMEEEKGGQKRGKKRAAGEMWRNRGRNVDGKFCLVPQWEAHAAATL